MADSSKKNKSDGNITLSNSAKEMINALSKNNKEILKNQFGIDKNFNSMSNKNSTLLNNIQKLVKQSFNNLIGKESDITEDDINVILHLASKKDKEKISDKSVRTKSLEDFKKVVSEKNNSDLAEIINLRQQSKTQLYASYDLILQLIPKMRLALNTISNSIISPDDFTKNSLNVIFDSDQITDDEKNDIKNSLDELIKHHGLNKNLKKDVDDFLIKGEMFYATISINEEINRLLKENSSTNEEIGYSKLKDECKINLQNLTENSSVNRYYYNEDSELLKEACSLFTDSSNKSFSNQILSEEINFLLENAIVTGNKNTFIKTDKDIQKQLSDVLIRNQTQNVSDNELIFTEDDIILKKLDPANTVKLEYNNKCYGYIYLDTFEEKTQKLGSVSQVDINKASPIGTVIYSGSDFNTDSNGGFANLNSNNDPATDKRLHFIANMFTNKLSKSENISILKNNENLKNAIYYSLKTKDILRKDKLRITYFSPEEVTHIDRGGSIFDNVLFFAKMYIATLITILMQNIVRGGDKRAYYIEVGLENDISNAVNSAIRDIKAKDIVGLQNYDIQQILQVVGEFNDYYLPTIDGEKPITFDTVSGLSNDSLDNDFLNWLSNNIFSGIGLPSAYLTEAENVDFAKTLAMQNSRHIRDILTDQNLLGIGYSCILRNLFNKKFIDNGTKTTIEKEEKENPTDGYSQLVFNKSNTETINDDKKEKNKKNSKDNEKTNSSNTIYETINLQSIRVLFPSPMSLNMTNLNDQISNFTSFLQPIIETITWNSDEDKTAGSAILTKKYLRKYISAIDWDEFDNMITETKSELNKEKLRKKSLDTTTNSTSSDPSASTDTPPTDSGTDSGEDLGDLGGDF